MGVGFAPVRRPKVGLVIPDVVPFERERHHGKVGPPIRCAQAGEIDVGEKAPVVGGLVSAATSLALPGLDPAAAIVAAMGATLSVSWKRPLVALLILILVLDTGFALPLLVGVGLGAVVHRASTATPSGSKKGEDRAPAAQNSGG